MSSTSDETSLAALAQSLIEGGHITQESWYAALTRSEGNANAAFQRLAKEGLLSKDDFYRAKAAQFNVEYINLEETPFDRKSLDGITMDTMNAIRTMRSVALVAADDQSVSFAMADPHDINTYRDLQYRFPSQHITVYFAPASIIAKFAEKHMSAGAQAATMGRKITNIADAEARGDTDEAARERARQGLSKDENYIADIVELILMEGLSSGASDIHIEPSPNQGSVKVRYRRHGVLYHAKDHNLPDYVLPLIVNRIRLLAKMATDNQYIPDNGTLRFNDADFRITTVPTVNGISMVVRVLGGNQIEAELDALQMSERSLNIIRDRISRKKGMIVVTGPTGSGKSTTMDSAINYVNSPEIKVWAVEDPVERRLPDVEQIEVNNDQGRTYEVVTKTLMRADPDILLIGEMTNPESAHVGIQMALTGHLVITTLHANDAAETFLRLRELGIQPYSASSAVSLVVAQRLVRTLCPNCRVDMDVPGREILERFPHLLGEFDPDEVFHLAEPFPQGCEECFFGYTGRAAITEVLPVTEGIRSILMENNGNIAAIRAQAAEEGMVPLAQDAWERVLAKTFSLQEAHLQTV